MRAGGPACFSDRSFTQPPLNYLPARAQQLISHLLAYLHTAAYPSTTCLLAHSSFVQVSLQFGDPIQHDFVVVLEGRNVLHSLLPVLSVLLLQG